MAVAQEHVTVAQEILTQLEQKIAANKDEISLGDGILQEQMQKLSIVNLEVESVQERLASIAVSFEAKSQEYETLLGQCELTAARKLEDDEQLAILSQELIALRQQRDNFTAEVDRLAAQRDNLAVEADQVRVALASSQESLDRLLAQTKQQVELQAQQQQAIDEQHKLTDQQELWLSQLQLQERQLQEKVDWLLSQLGELERLSLAQLANQPAHDDPNLISEPDVEMADRQARLDGLRQDESRLTEVLADLNQQMESLNRDRQDREQQVEASPSSMRR